MTFSAADMARLVAAARAAGERILPYFRRPETHGRSTKADDSPLTRADMAAHDYLREALGHDFPGIAVVSEEDAVPTAPVRGQPYFLVDPLDGTRSFVRGEDEFTVNIGLVEAGLPVAGVLAAPARRVLYYGGVGLPPVRQAYDAAAEPIRVRATPENGLTVARSRSAPSAKSKAFLQSLRVGEIISASSAIKFGWVADGTADVYPRFGRTMEWDTAAGHAILDAAGGCVTLVDGTPLLYGKPGFENEAFIAWGNKAGDER